jgi:hypothetical protein
MRMLVVSESGTSLVVLTTAAPPPINFSRFRSAGREGAYRSWQARQGRARPAVHPGRGCGQAGTLNRHVSAVGALLTDTPLARELVRRARLLERAQRRLR